MPRGQMDRPTPIGQRVEVVRVQAHPTHADRFTVTTRGGSRGEMTLAALARFYRIADDCELPPEWLELPL